MENDKAHFKKLKISTLLDLALIVPSSYSDTTLSAILEAGMTGTYEAVVEEISNMRGKLKVVFFLPKFSKRVTSLFFRATPYHYQLFTKGSQHTIQGRVEVYNGYLQIPQPKSIKEIGRIIPKYKSTLKQGELITLIQRYVTERNLYHEGLDSAEVAAVMRIHFPKEMGDIYEENRYRKQIIQKLKFIEAFNHLKKLRGKRADFPAIRALHGDIGGFVKGLPFRLTQEQQEVIAQIQVDLSREDKAAKRMVVGDVGSGKTMVILASVMMVWPHTSILMAPTSLLALQLFEEACKHLNINKATIITFDHEEELIYKDIEVNIVPFYKYFLEKKYLLDNEKN